MLKGSNYNISRAFAAEILNVSLRTLDRYAKKKTVSSVRRGRQLFFSEDELLSYKADLIAREDLMIKREQVQGMEEARRDDFVEVQQAQQREQTFHSRQPEPVNIRSVRTGVEGEQMSGAEDQIGIQDDPILGTLSRKIMSSSPELAVYKQMYVDAKTELKQMRDQLYLAHQRVGQLEIELKGRAPLLEYKKQQQEVMMLTEKTTEQEEKIATFKRKMDLHMREMDEIQFQLKIEKVSKFVYGVLLFLVSVTVPIALILRLAG
jgi:DNA-binding transcriptional MerR regulator